MSEAKSEDGRKRLCRCEARIAPAILDGYACGDRECWRTEEVEASFADFIVKLATLRDKGQVEKPR